MSPSLGDGTGELLLLSLEMGQKVLLQVSKRKEEWSHTFTDLKPSSLYRVTLGVSKLDPEVRKVAKIYCQALLQKTCTCGILKLKIGFLVQSYPLLVFVTVNGDTVAHLQVSVVLLEQELQGGKNFEETQNFINNLEQFYVKM